MKVQKTFVILSLFVIGFSYTNCGQVGQIELKSISAIEQNYSAVTNPANDPVRDILLNCQNALANNKLMVMNQKINFEDSRIETKKEMICEFATEGKITSLGNLEMHNQFMQARYEQNRSLNLPQGAVICDIQMKNDLQKFKYDDVFFFSFNGYLLATNNKPSIEERLIPESRKLSENQFTSLYRYDWLKLRGAGFENEPNDYCVGATEGLSQCAWPITEQEGSIKLSFSPSVLVAMSSDRPSNNQVFSFAITGDNNPESDCYHEKLEFAMTVRYYIPAADDSKF